MIQKKKKKIIVCNIRIKRVAHAFKRPLTRCKPVSGHKAKHKLVASHRTAHIDHDMIGFGAEVVVTHFRQKNVGVALGESGHLTDKTADARHIDTRAAGF